MKKIYFIICISLFACQFLTASNTDQPEKIYPLARVSKSLNFYKTQAKLWKTETEKNPTDAAAWWNYFLAARYANMFTQEGEKPFDLNALVTKLAASIPNTFEFHYLTYLQKGLGPNSFKDLEKAYKVGGDRPEIFHSMINYHTINGNREGVRDFCEKWYASGDYSSSMMNWNYNLLQSIEEDAILITWGDNDSYPAWTLQNVKGEKGNALVWNIWLLNGFDDYRNRVFEKADLPKFERTSNSNQVIQLLEHITKNANRPIYFAPSIRQNVRNRFDHNLYWTGLAFKYSMETFDNVAIIKNNFENKFLKDYLTMNFDKDISKDLVNNLNLHYLPPFLRLYKHYQDSGENEKAGNLKKLIYHIAEKGGKKEDIDTYFGAMAPKMAIKSNLNIKDLDRNFQKLEGNLYAAHVETTNKQYEDFLMDLLINKKFEKLETAKAPKVNWRAFLPEKFKSLSDGQLYRNGDPNAERAPIVNISHEAAKLYCQWITDVYNASDYKKKKYKKVLFRLPNEREWILTAKGGYNANYPWGGSEYTNQKGCYLSNFDVAAEAPCTDCKVQFESNDGAFFPVNSYAYFPNNFGCFNMSGNVAEMIDTEGFALGGSWADKPEECLVTSSQKYQERSPKVGFRVFMVVLEY